MVRLYRSVNEQYICDTFLEEDAELEAVFKSAGNKKGIQLSATEGKLLQFLIKLSGANKIVEIGTLVGYSTLWMAKSIDSSGHIYSIEKSPENYAIASQNLSKWKKNVTLFKGIASEVLSELTAHQPFDMIFIDADKNNYPYYLDWAEKYIKPKGLIVADNTLLFNTITQYSEKPAWKAIREFNSRLGKNKNYYSTLLTTPDGLTVAIKNF